MLIPKTIPSEKCMNRFSFNYDDDKRVEIFSRDELTTVTKAKCTAMRTIGHDRLPCVVILARARDPHHL